MRRGRRSVVFAALLLIVALSLLAAACGGGSTSSNQGGGSTSSNQASTGPASTEGQTTQVAKDTGTLEFGLTEEEYAAHIEKTQALIASCMSEAGFEYVPADVESVAKAQTAVRTEPGMDREEYKKRWGYGVSTRFDNRVKEIELGLQNLAIFENLSEADQVAYERTLYGEDPDATFAFTFDEEDFSGTGGCTRKAIEQVFTPEQLKDTYVNPKDILVESDPRVVEADANWVACMQDAGYDGYLDQDEIIEEFEERFDTLTEGEDPTTLTVAQAEELKQMQAEEIAISLADLDCQIKYQDSVIKEVEIELFGHPVSG
jgi:hypothetical protein